MSRLEDLHSRIESRDAHIGVVGLGYVGLPLALEFAKVGFTVTGFDLDAEKIKILAAGGTYIEDVPAAEVSRLLSEKPDIAGLAVPGMPAGSPGMEVAGVSQPYDVLTFDRSGQIGIYASYTP